MLTPEKNDIDISPLFNWFDSFELVLPNGETKETVYIRIIGDAEMNRARVMALRKSAELRKSLHDLNSDNRVAYVPDKEVVTRDKILAYLAFVRTKTVYSEVAKEVNVPFPKEPASDATLEKMEAYQIAIDEYPVLFRETVDKEANKKVIAEINKLNEKTDEELYRIYVETLINELCESEMFDRFIDYCTYFGSYSDEEMTQKYFKSLEQFENLPSMIKKQFVEAYNTLEVDMSTLKK